MTSNTVRQIVGLILVVLSAMISTALLPAPDYVLDPFVKYLLGIINAGLVMGALYLNVRMPGQSGSAG